MKNSPSLQLSERTLKGLFFLNKYRFLTISQFAHISGYSYSFAKELLRGLTKHGAVGYFGFQSVPGQGKTPKVYYPKEKAYQYLLWESGYQPEDLGQFIPVQDEIVWTPETFHRLKIIDLFLALELAVEKQQHLSLVKVFLSYRRVPKTNLRETTDSIDNARIIPDGAFVLHNFETDRRGLFFIEMDMGSERLTAPKSRDQRSTIKGKLEAYDRYLTTGRFAQTYQAYGEFRSFLLLFVTVSEERILNIRRLSRAFPQQLHQYYRLATIPLVTTNFFGQNWYSRSPSDTLRYALIQPGS